MVLSKKEISILIEIVFSVLFAIVYLPFFFENQFISYVFGDLIQQVIEIILFAAIYFTITYGLLEVSYKAKTTDDERDDMIHSKSYKLGYILYEISLFVCIGILINSPNTPNGAIVFSILALVLSVSLVKSTYQFYLYRTF